MNKPQVAGVILAAGGSRRFGAPQQLLPINGQPMLRHVIDAALPAQLAEVVVVLGSHANDIIKALDPQAIKPSTHEYTNDVRFVICEDWAQGASASLRTGMALISEDMHAAAILLGDQPGVTTELIDTVVSAFAASDQPIARPVYGEERTPSHPVVIDRTLFADCLTLEGDVGAGQLLAARPNQVLTIEIPGTVPRDVDTPADYAQVSERLKR